MISPKNIILILFLLLSGLEVKAQFVASAGYETDARTLGFGGAGVALDANALSLYRNTAAIVFSDADMKTAASYSYTPLFDDAKLHTAGGYYLFNEKQALAIGARYYTATEIENTDDGLTFQTVKPYDLLIDLGYAHKLNDVLSLSVNLRYIYSKINEGQSFENGNSLAMDLGLYFRKNEYSAALAVYNPGKLIDYGIDKFRMPANVKAGGAYRYSIAENHKLTTSIEGRYNFLPGDYTFFSGGAGLEYMFAGRVALRGGYHLASESKSAGNYGSVGAGVYLGPVVIDFAYLLTKSETSAMHKAWCITAGVRF